MEKEALKQEIKEALAAKDGRKLGKIIHEIKLVEFLKIKKELQDEERKND